MTTKILITGLNSGSTEESIGSWLSHFGSVVRVKVIRNGNAEKPAALAEMDISEAAAAHLVSRLTEYWHDGKLVTAHLLHH